MDAYISPLDLVRERSPHRPVALARPDAAGAAARWFRNTFKGSVLYAVKANPSPWMIRALSEAGIDAFDVASLAEIELVAEHAPGARLAFMHPVKSREAIAAAYHDHGVRAFALDSEAELAKIIEATGGAGELDLIVRMAVTAPGAAYAFGGKFGVTPADAPDLLLAARRATDGLMGVSFHVGSQCMRPAAFPAAMAQVSRALVRAGVFADVVDVGGGFPSIYPGMTPPEMSQYIAAIDAGFEAMMVHETTELWCEPGRALCAEASSLLTRVELRRGDALHLNDGAFGSLFDAAHLKWPFPVKRWRGDWSPSPLAGEGGAKRRMRARAQPSDWREQDEARRRDPSSGLSGHLLPQGEKEDAPLRPFHFYGPTCDPTDHMPGPFWLPEDTREGDTIEIGMLGAYGVALGTRFNGFGEVETRRVGDPPMASMYGLAPRALPAPPAPLKEGAAR